MKTCDFFEAFINLLRDGDDCMNAFDKYIPICFLVKGICLADGNIEQGKALIKKAHQFNIKVIMDMVFNHTAPDSILFKEHPEFYFYKNGKPGNRVGDWTDIIDLDTSKKGTQDYLMKVLRYWRELGVDGFRFDVASLIPLSFFKRARKALGKKVIFIGESVEDSFVHYLKKNGIKTTPDKDMYPTFDILYNYNWFPELMTYVKGGDYMPLINKLKLQEETMPKNYIRVNCLDNHDNARIAELLQQNPLKLKEILNFVYFIKGCTFVYMGDEFGNAHKPELFEKDPVDWTFVDNDLKDWYETLIKEKANPFNNKIVKQTFTVMDDNKVKVELVNNKGATKVRVFDFGL